MNHRNNVNLPLFIQLAKVNNNHKMNEKNPVVSMYGP